MKDILFFLFLFFAMCFEVKKEEAKPAKAENKKAVKEWKQ